MRNLRTLAASLAVALVTIFAAPSAEALTIRISDDGGATFTTVTDGGLGDASPLAGNVSFAAAFPTFQIVLTAGYSDPLTGPSTSPFLVFNLEAFSLNGGVLIAELSDNFFGPSGTTAIATLATPPPLNLTDPPFPLAAISVVGYETFYDPGNVEFAPTFSLTGPIVGPGAAAGVLPSGAFPYSLTQRIVIATQPGVATASTTLSVPVPDGGLALSLLGFALVGVEGLRRRIKK
jgi:hypothetical protein